MIDDEEVARRLYRRLMARFQAQYDIVSSLEEARRCLATSETYDLLVTDMRLPDGRGSDFAVEFRRKFPQGRVLIITGSPETISSAKPDQIAPGAEWLFKPFELEDFTRVLERLLSK